MSLLAATTIVVELRAGRALDAGRLQISGPSSNGAEARAGDEPRGYSQPGPLHRLHRPREPTWTHVFKVSAIGSIDVVAGNSNDTGCCGDFGPAAQAKFDHPERIALDASGNEYIADTDNDELRRIGREGRIELVD